MADQYARTSNDVEEILRLVAEGHMTPEEADAVLSDLERERRDARPRDAEDEPRDRGRSDMWERPVRHARIEVTERGRSVVNLRVPIVPLSLGRYALAHMPGLSEANVDHITDAIERGLTGRILEVQDDDGDGVRIVVE
jgi:hypothetical protein